VLLKPAPKRVPMETTTLPFVTLAFSAVLPLTPCLVGQAVYLASAATFGTALTTTVGSNKLVGYAIKAKGAVAGDVFVRINN
jgi:hypothetical protein